MAVFLCSKTGGIWDYSIDIDFGVASGVQVDELRAMQTSAVYACIKALAETVASLPLFLYRNEKDKNTKAREHPLYEVLHNLPNGEMTSFNFREVMMTSLLLYGNAYARIIRDKSGHVKELWYLKPQNMKVERIGLALATEEFGARFFGNGARPGGVLEHPGAIKDPEKLRESWNKVYQGTRNSNKVAVLEEGMKYHEIGLSPEASQFLQTRKYQLNEICRIFRVPPHLVGDLERSTFSNIEHQSIDFVTHTIRPWLVRWEQAIYKSLLSEKERRIYYVKFNVDGLLRGDFATRMQGYATARQNGWMSINEIRALEEMNPYRGLEKLHSGTEGVDSVGRRRFQYSHRPNRTGGAANRVS